MILDRPHAQIPHTRPAASALPVRPRHGADRHGHARRAGRHSPVARSARRRARARRVARSRQPHLCRAHQDEFDGATPHGRAGRPRVVHCVLSDARARRGGDRDTALGRRGGRRLLPRGPDDRAAALGARAFHARRADVCVCDGRIRYVRVRFRFAARNHSRKN